MIKRKLKLSILAIILISTQSYAATERHTVPLTCDPMIVSNFSGSSNFINTINSWQQEITSNTTTTVTDINIGTQAVLQALGTGMADVSTSAAQASQDAVERELDMHKALEATRREFEMQLLEEKRKEGLGLTAGETKEEIEFIIEMIDLGIEKEMSIREIEALMLSQYDESGTITIGIATHSGNVNCSEEQISSGDCTLPRKIKPAETMMAYFESCNQTKIAQVKTQRESVGRVAVINHEAERIADAMNNVNPSGLIAKRREETKNLNCTPELKMSGYCQQDISEEDFQDKMARNQIVPNGHISPTNAFSPSDFGGIEYGMELTPETVAVLREEAFHYDDFEKYENQNPEQAPIIYTYRNSSQLKAALSFVDSIVNDALVGNQEERFRNLPRSAEFQARYSSRIASLNLVRNSFNDSVRIRTGRDLGNIWAGEDDQYSSLDEIPEDEVVKESYLGAGELDLLINEINSAYQEISLSGGVNPADQQNKVEDANEKYWLMENYKVINMQNQVLLRQMIQNERMELIRAAQLQNIINNPKNIEYLNSIRSQ